MWFFGDLASMKRQDYKAALTDWSEQDLVDTMIAQNHILSVNVWTKHQALNRAITLTIVALVLLFGLGIAYGTAMANLPLLPASGAGLSR